MTEVLLGVLALIPALIGLGGSRRRRLTLLRQEVEVLNAMPASMTAPRARIAKRVEDGVDSYLQRPSGDWFFFLAPAVAWILLLAGAYVYDGTLTTDTTLEQLRQTGGFVLMLFGIGTLLLFGAAVVYRCYAWLRTVRARTSGRKIARSNRKLHADLRRELAEADKNVALLKTRGQLNAESEALIDSFERIRAHLLEGLGRLEKPAG